MPKVPAYKRGVSLVKGEPDRKLIKPTTIDRAKYQSILDKPLNTGDNFVTSDPNSFVPDVMATQGFNYHSGTVKGKDLLYKKGNNFYLYNEQPGDGGASNYGLVNIGDMSEPKVQTAPTVTTTPAVMPVDPMKQEGFNGMLKAQTIQYKNGGKVKGYFGGGDVDYDNGMPTDASLSPSPSVPTTSEYQSAITAAQQKNLDKQKKLKLSSDTSKALGATALTVGNQMYQRGYGPSANQEVENKYDNVVAVVDAAASSLIPWYGMAKGASNIAKSQIKRDEFGQPTTKVGSVANDWLTPYHELIMQGYKQDGLKGALRESSGLGNIGRTVSTLTGNSGDTSGIWGKVNKFTGQADKNKSAAADAAIKQAQLDAQASQEAKRKDYINEARISEAIAARDAGDTKYKSTPLTSLYQPQAAAEGGEIKGKGGPKSDSINAKVEAGSFIVPAENADLAKQLVSKVLGKNPSKKAKLNQGGETPVKLSDGEYMFSPEEKAELESYGYDLSALAPNADPDDMGKKNGGLTSEKAKIMLKDNQANGKPLTPAQKRYFGWVAGGSKAMGGEVKGYASGGGVDPKKELAKINALSAKEIADRNAKEKAQSELNKSTSQKLKKAEDVRRAKAEHDRLSSGIEMLNKQYEDLNAAEKDKSKRLIGQSDERIRAEKIKVLNQIDKLQQDRDAIKATFDTAPSVKKVAVASEVAGGLNYLQGDKPTTQPLFNPSPLNPNIQSAAPVTKKAPSLGGKGIKASAAPVSSANQSPFSRDWAAENTGPSEVPVQEQVAIANQDAQVTSPSSNGNATSTAGGGTPSPADGTQRKGINWEGIGSNAVNYGLPILQTAIGLKKLKELGKRPKDTLDPQYLQAIAKTSGDVQTARENAKFGYTGDELAALNQENTGLTNAGRAFARNVAGGSAAAGLNAERSVLNDAFGRKLQSRISDNALRMQKQEQAMARQQDLNSMLAHKQELNRRLFGDTLNAWNQDQSSAGSLVNAGLSNAIDSMKYANFKKQYEDAQNKYQF